MPFSTELAVRKIMRTPEGRQKAYLCYYEWDAYNAYERFLESEEWEAIRDLLSKYQFPINKALDLGAGNGISSYALEREGFNVVSLEPDPSNLVGYGALKHVLYQKNLTIKQVSAFGESLPFPDNTFGLIYCRQVLHHSKKLKKMLDEIARVLIQGGIFIATREHVIDDEASLETFLNTHALNRFTLSEGAYPLEEYLNTIKSSGLIIKKTLLSWDSVINHYPKSNADIKKKFEKKLIEKFGRSGHFLTNLSFLIKIYRYKKSNEDITPGRMVSFIAVKINH